MLKIRRLVFSSGKGNSILRSIRPGKQNHRIVKNLNQITLLIDTIGTNLIQTCLINVNAVIDYFAVDFTLCYNKLFELKQRTNNRQQPQPDPK